MDLSPYLLALDQGTSSSRSIVFDAGGRVVAMAQREFRQIFPRPGWVEHDPEEIWESQFATARDALAQAQLRADDIAAIGITNQRETTVVWNRHSGVPLGNAIVWQDRRGEDACTDLRRRGFTPLVHERTGLVIDAYFSGTKLKWILDHTPGARAAAERGDLAFGTIDSWLLWRLTGGEHATDVSNASRTMLFDVRRNVWDDDLLAMLDIPRAVLPAVHPSSHRFGLTRAELFGVPILIGGIAGDQQSALFGQACFTEGMAKNTYGTGCFLLLHCGSEWLDSGNGLITTRAAQTGTMAASQPEYALEGSVFIGGAVVQWLRDGLGAIASSAEIDALAARVPDSGGVVFVPAFTGLGAPYWKPDARGAILGLSRGSTMAHVARAAVESIAFQSTALLRAMSRDLAARGGGQVLRELRVDGGACVNDELMQFQADLLGIPVLRPKVTETTAQGAAFLAGLAGGVYRDRDEIAAHWQLDRQFDPATSRDRADELMATWEEAVARVAS